MLSLLSYVCSTQIYRSLFTDCLSDLALAVSKAVEGEEFHIVLILFILVIVMLLCHSLIRLCMLARKVSRERKPDLRNGDGVEDFARIEEPIQVILARDEEIGISGHKEDNKKEVTAPPPIYGLWRGSVVRMPISSLAELYLTA